MAAQTALAAGMQITKAVTLVRPLRSGGMGAVWLADHLGLKTQVVVKFMLGDLEASESLRSRFSREAAAAAQVKSPHVVQMLDHGVSDEGVPFIVMEHLVGHDLGNEIETHGALDPAKVVAVVSQIAKALSKVHAAGLLHRDIKPDNIFLVDGEEEVFAKLLDFGIAKSSLDPSDGGPLDAETKTGQIVGTPFYMSPEQVTAQKVIDNRSDLWALGVVAFEALTGQRPFDGPSFGALAVKIATGVPPRPTEVLPSLPPTMDGWFAKACARDPAQRFATAKEMSDAFRSAFDGILSLPGSDSGQRGAHESSGARSGPRAVPSSSPTLGLAATALDDSDGSRKVALGASEAGVSLVEATRSNPQSSPLLYVVGATALIAVVATVLVLRSGATETRTPPRAASAAIASEAATAPAPTVTVTVTATATTGAIVSVDAGAPAATGAATTAAPRPIAPTRGATNVALKHSAEPPPKAAAKPSSSEPDLF